MSAAVGFDTPDSYGDTIAVHGALRGFLGDVDVAAQTFNGLVGNNERITVAMDTETALNGLAGTHVPLSNASTGSMTHHFLLVHTTVRDSQKTLGAHTVIREG